MPGSPVSFHSPISCEPAASPRTSRPTSRHPWSGPCGRARRTWRCATRPAICSPSSPTTGCCRFPARRRGVRSAAVRGATSSGIAVGLAKIWLSSPVVSVRRYPDGVQVRDASGEARDFDAAVIATHPDQALRLLDTATREEQSVLGAFRYTPNQAVLHTDSSPSPGARQRPRVLELLAGLWRGASRGAAADQLLPEPAPAPADGARLHRHARRFRRRLTRRGASPPCGMPIPFTRGSRWPRSRGCPGLNNAVTAFAGAYHGWGFHEDGCRSGVAAARALWAARGW